MSTPRTRLKDVAESTGFSVNTVSLALRASPRIPSETSALILEAARRLDYVPNRAARSLVERTSRTIGLVLTDLRNPTQTMAAQAIERRLADAGYSMMLAASDNSVKNELTAIGTLRSHQVDGLLIYPANHGKLGHIRRLRTIGQPIVLLGAERRAGLDIVAVDDRQGAFKAVNHLASLGHKQIAFFDAGVNLGNREKYEGYLQALAAHKIKPNDALSPDPGGHGARSGFEAMEKLMRRRPRPTALFTPNDDLALGAMAWCRDHGVDVPADLAVVGYDNIELAPFAWPPLTTINYDTDVVSAAAIDRLLALAENPNRKSQVTLIEPELIVRESCGATAARRNFL